ncbi:protein-L-isoaspartate O-methyltransferase [Sphingoaurantiacus capsulatus]|uniref:Protein-L-isoaspartate O-methyltransferase n=1 Tax=Sphingoaurantiacus capsulatus TaxID=1771310 RepID=A0ABV7XD01_9SPHN
MNQQPSFDEMRQTMIDCQLRPTGVSDPRVVEAFAATPRERFVPADRAGLAYVDEDLAIAPGRYLMDPMAFGQLLMGGAFKAHERVLVVGAATGYAAAVIARLVREVVALESDTALAATARTNLDAEGADNATVVEGPLAGGWPQSGPYDVLFFDGAVAAVPPALLAQLKDGGRVVGVIVDADGVQRGASGIVYGGAVGKSEFADISVRPLPGFDRPKQFTF